MDIDCCGGGTYTLSPGEQFDFVNNQSQEVQVTGCNPPLAALNYTVPAAQGGTPGRCAAQIATGATDGSYGLTVSGCGALPPGAPTIRVSG
jgi:hypothetical protein